MDIREYPLSMRPVRNAMLTTALCFGLTSFATAQAVKLDVVYLPTPYDGVHRMLEMADLQPDDYLVDLGSGDGRIVVQAARDWGVKRALGVDIDPERIAEANENARKAGVEDRVRFIRKDLFELDFSSADVLTLYLLESLNIKLRPVILDELAPGTRVVSHVFKMGDWEPDQTVVARGLSAFMWIVPAKVAGDWRVELPDGTSLRITLEQKYQQIEGTYRVTGTDAHELSFAALRGDEIRLSAAGKHFTGKVEGDVITGLPRAGEVAGWRATRL